VDSSPPHDGRPAYRGEGRASLAPLLKPLATPLALVLNELCQPCSCALRDQSYAQGQSLAEKDGTLSVRQVFVAAVVATFIDELLGGGEILLG